MVLRSGCIGPRARTVIVPGTRDEIRSIHTCERHALRKYDLDGHGIVPVIHKQTPRE